MYTTLYNTVYNIIMYLQPVHFLPKHFSVTNFIIFFNARGIFFFNLYGSIVS